MAAAEVTAVMVGEVAVTDLAGEVLAVMVVGGTAGKVTSVEQSKLSERGYYQGPIDGVIGAGSRRAIRSFQAEEGLPVTGSIDSKLLRALRIG
jgi:peptidoglycan hydrolase-like protein with peptidoglycan-binding domain